MQILCIHNFKYAHLRIADNVSGKPETLILLAVNKSVDNSIMFLLGSLSKDAKMRLSIFLFCSPFAMDLSKQLGDKIV